MIATDSKARITLSLLFAYLFSIGMTWNGIILSQFKMISLWIMVATLLVWVYIRHKSKWAWHSTPLDTVLIIWVLSFMLSTLFNTDSIRRISISMWYIVLYICLWYILHDFIANGAIKRYVLADAIMFGGIIVVGVGYYQLAIIGFGVGDFTLPRPGSILGNANSLGTFLVMLLAVTLSRLLETQNRLARIIVGFYSFAIAILLFTTFSRGAWLGAIVMLLTLAALALHSKSLLSISKLQLWWKHQSKRQKTTLLLTLILVVIVGLIVGIFLVWSISQRPIGLRGEIYENATNIFEEKPITGHGLFTFGKYFALEQSQPPDSPYSHAHNVFLHVAAEQGFFGVLAVLFTMVVFLKAIWNQWQESPQHEQMALAGSIAGVTGFGVHHLLDMTMMMPLIAFLGLIMLRMSTSASQNPSWKMKLYPSLIMGIWVLLIITGFWSANIHAIYDSAIEDALLNKSFRPAAERIQEAIDKDPLIPVYHNQQALFYGAAAYQGDFGAIQLGIDAYQNYLDLEPYDAIAWTNMAALYAQKRDFEQAITAMQEATSLAPSSSEVWYILGIYAEKAGDFDLAREAYQHVPLRIFAFTSEQTTLQAELANDYEPTGRDAVILGQSDTFAIQEISRDYIIALLVSNKLTEQRALLEKADQLADANNDWAWVQFGKAFIARQRGNEALAQQEIQLIYDTLDNNYTWSDYKLGHNIMSFQFLRYSAPRQFLIQAHFPSIDVELSFLINQFQT